MGAVACTDSGNMFGAVDFYNKAKGAGVKPIIGMEVYICEDRLKKQDKKISHLVLLAKDLTGYQNLLYLASQSYLEGLHMGKPRLDKVILKERSKGLIALSGGLEGEVAQTIFRYGEEEAVKIALEYQQLFDKDSYYLEVIPDESSEKRQKYINDIVRTISQTTGIPVVATNDCHYIDPQEARAHEILSCIRDKNTIYDERRLKKEDGFYFKTEQEMRDAFPGWDEAIDNAGKIADQCNLEIPLGKVFLPQYPIPEGHTVNTYLTLLANEGLQFRLNELQIPQDQHKTYQDRLDYELGVIFKMGFAGYFLLVGNFIKWTKDQGIPVGPGRGSGAGRIVAYSLKITNLDPIRFKLLFERFLNPERVSMPDFDIDFCMNRRDEVLKYVIGKYGNTHVGQIATFHQLKSRGTIRDVARATGKPLSDADRVAKLIPDPKQGRAPTIEQALREEPRLKALYEESPDVREIIDYAKALEGLNRHAGMHAAGILIGDNDLWNYVPCFNGPGGELVSQFSMGDSEAAGLIKFDFLGLRTLTVIDTAVKIINKNRAQDNQLDIEKIPLDDASVYTMIASGETNGVFQLESDGIQEMIRRLKPERIEDIIAAVALYRPGPMQSGMMDDYINCKNGSKKVVYLHPLLEETLKDTYGGMIYQEQVLEAAKVLAGYSLGQADLLRRAMGKKIPEKMAIERDKFVNGCVKNNITKEQGTEIFNKIEAFADYGFNLSHSAAYGLITYQTAYLKYHFPNEFIAATLSCEKNKNDAVVRFINEAKNMGLKILPPDINESDLDFTVHGDNDKYIRFGLAAVKGVGEIAVVSILANRKNQKFTSLYDFCRRADSKTNKRVIEALIKAGAFDHLGNQNGHNRNQMVLALDVALKKTSKVKNVNQASIFDLPNIEKPTDTYPVAEEWTPQLLLKNEREALGFYITGHPLNRFSKDIGKYSNASTAHLDFLVDSDKKARLGAMVTAYKEKNTKTGKRMAFFRAEDQYGSIEAVVFAKNLDKLRAVLTSEEPLLLVGQIRAEGDEDNDTFVNKIFIDDAISLLQARSENISGVVLNIKNYSKEYFESILNILSRHPGSHDVYMSIYSNGADTIIPLENKYCVSISEEFLLDIEKALGQENVKMK